LRRQAQLKAFRPDLTVLPVRGNVDTRIRKALQGEYDAVVLAAAGIERLDLKQHVSEYISFEIMLPAPGQGALAVQCRADDSELLELLRPIHHLATFRAVSAERAFLAALGGGCAAPVAAFAKENGALLDIDGLVASVDGQYVIRTDATGPEPAELGQLLAKRVLDLGGGSLLK
jgi:hydroxymethylbilane synthase